MTSHFWDAELAKTLILGGAVLFFGLAFVLPALNSAINHREETVAEYAATLPQCPDSGLTYYEKEPTWHGAKFTSQALSQAGWSNVQTVERQNGGIFGGHTTIVTGECPQNATEESVE